MNYVLTLLSALLPSRKKSKSLEEKLMRAHSNIREWVAAVDMNYDSGKVINVPISKVWMTACDGVREVECQLPTTECTLLNVILDPGATVPRHFHDLQTEIIFVVQGKITDLDNGVSKNNHEVYVINPKQYHTIHSESGALLNVLFVPKFHKFYEAPDGDLPKVGDTPLSPC